MMRIVKYTHIFDSICIILEPDFYDAVSKLYIPKILKFC